MRKKLPLFLILLLSHMIYCQKESNIWYFGNHAGLDFNAGNPVALTNGELNANEGTASIADSSGQLLFYTDGSNVWNADHTLMLNGTGLMGNASSSQAALIVPKPGSGIIYYIFTTDASGGSNGLRYSEVNMSLEAGKGNVTDVKNVLLSSPTCEKLTAVKKADNSGYWVLSHGFLNNNFLAYSVTSTGVDENPIISSAGLPILESIQTVGQLKISPDGTKIINCSFKRPLELYDFDSSTGIVSNLQYLNNKKSNYGAEFSPSGNVLYVTTGSDAYIFDLVQYDLTATDIGATEITLKTNTLYQFGAMQLGPDGKIYLPITNSNYISCIDQPENIGIGCNFIKNGIFLGTRQCTFGLPQFVQSNFSASSLVQHICLGSAATFSLSEELNITAIDWDFGDGSTSNENNTTHQYALPGLYNVNVIAQGNTGTIAKQWQVLVSEVPFATRIANQVLCGDETTVYNLNQNDAAILGNQNPMEFKVDYFLSEEDAFENSNKLSTDYNLPLGTTTFFAKVYNSKNIQCFEITSFTVSLVEILNIGQLTDYILCQNQPNSLIGQFQLDSKNLEVLNGLNENQFTISYHSSQENAEDDFAPLPNQYTNTVAEETIFVRLENNHDSSCFAITSFVIRVIEQPIIGSITPLLACGDVSGNGTAVFDLTEKNSEILGNLNPSFYSVSYYAYEANAVSGINPIMSPYINVVNYQTLFVAINSIGNSCRVVGSFTLIVTPKPARHRSRNIRVCDDAVNDGKEVFDFSSHANKLLEEQIPDTFSVTYHVSNGDAQNDANPLPLNYQNLSNPQIIYTRTESIFNPNCYEVSFFEIRVDALPFATKPDDLNLCSNLPGGNVADVDLHVLDLSILNGQPASHYNVSYYASLEDAVTGGIELIPTYQNTVSTRHIFARVHNAHNSTCFAITDFNVNVFPKPILEMEDVYSFCQNNIIVLNAPSGFDSYLWSTGSTSQSISIDTVINGSLTVTKNYGPITCDTTVTFSTIQSSVPIIVEIEIKDWTENQNSIQVITNGNGDYEYSIDGENYQDSPYFHALEMGQYTVYVKDKNNCGITSKDIYLLVYPKYFTPNGDNHNEKWQIKFSNFEPNLEVSIFDKYGKLITVFDGKSDGWDGTCNNVALPSSDYWFIVKRKSGIAYKGHFALLR